MVASTQSCRRPRNGRSYELAEVPNGKKTGGWMAQIKSHPTLGNIHAGSPPS
jgi:hypothetical protein